MVLVIMEVKEAMSIQTLTTWLPSVSNRSVWPSFGKYIPVQDTVLTCTIALQKSVRNFVSSTDHYHWIHPHFRTQVNDPFPTVDSLTKLA